MSVDWLQKYLRHPDLIVLDASIPKVVGNDTHSNKVQIPSSRFFDLKNKFSEINAPFPTTFPSENQFTEEARNLGINKNSLIVVYDEKGIYSSPRAWWLFKAFGFDNVAVLNGGLPAWEKSGYPTEKKQNSMVEKGNFEAQLQSKYMKFFDDVKKESKDHNHLIIDARSEDRFKSKVAEPREGLRSGTIPSSINLPFECLIDDDGLLKSEIELKQLFQSITEKNKAITFSCGSGITACVLALGAEISGYQNISVYDGSWTEWGSLSTL